MKFRDIFYRIHYTNGVSVHIDTHGTELLCQMRGDFCSCMQALPGMGGIRKMWMSKAVHLSCRCGRRFEVVVERMPYGAYTGIVIEGWERQAVLDVLEKMAAADDHEFHRIRWDVISIRQRLSVIPA